MKKDTTGTQPINEVKHTPGPWEYRYSALLDVHSVKTPDKDICTLIGKKAEVNAKRIVTAVNMHDELVKALKEAKDCIYNAINKRYPVALFNVWHSIDDVLYKESKATNS